MKIITDDHCTAYATPGHPERPGRVSRTVDFLKAQTEIEITWVKPEPCLEESVLRAHSPEMFRRLEVAEDFDSDTPFYPDIAHHARAAAGAALEALRCARKGELVFSLMRPPGHHATRNRSMGFCYLNNVAIAALEALATGANRVAVYDFDVHHGNGTEDILLNRKGTMFFSVHQYPAYPGTGGQNVGNNCFNYPVGEYTARAQYREVLSAALEELKRFKPEIVFVSAGFDAYARDPLSQETLETEDFYWLGQNLRALGQPVVSLLEGGYSRDLPELIFAYLKGLQGI